MEPLPTPLERPSRRCSDIDTTLGRRAWIPEDEAITYIALVAAGGHRLKAEDEYLLAARNGELPVRGRSSVSSLARELIPRERWQLAFHQALPDPLCGVFHWPGWEVWSDREVRTVDLEWLWPGAVSTPAAAAVSGGPLPPKTPDPGPPAPPGIEPERWRAIWVKYVDHVRDVQEEHGREPKISEDNEWRGHPGIDIAREEVRKLRKFRDQAPPKQMK
jgi:hypothetical protein